MASLTCLGPTHSLLLGHRGSTFHVISSRCFNYSSSASVDRVLFSTNRPKASFSAAQHELASPGDLEYEAPLKIVEYPDPKLRARNKRIATFDDNLKKLVHEMFDVMYKTDGIGLSAPQVGINVQLMVFNPVGERGEGEEIVLINPRVRKYSKKLIPYNEGCLSFPGISADVKRPESVKIDALDINGTRFSINLSDLPARIFQHEFDHLQIISVDRALNAFVNMESKALNTVIELDQNGILFFDRMTEEVLDSIRRQLQALEMKYERMTGFPSPEKIENRRMRKIAAGFGKL